jgi:SAM-dependent methyltransferase
MHTEAKEFIQRIASRMAECGYSKLVAVDLGGRETNGHARDVFYPEIEWTVVDAVKGPGVDVVANAVYWRPPAPVDLVMCAEVFEHTPYWAKIIHNAFRMLREDGRFICTAAGIGREVHGVNHDDPDQPGWYENIEADCLKFALQAAGFSYTEVDYNSKSHDVYGYAVK